MKKQLFCALAVALSANGWAQTNITPEVLQTLQGSYTGTPAEKAMRNAISSVSLKKMALNQENTHNKDTHFNVEVKNTGISDQESSGRCWLFTGTNVLRQRAMKKLGVDNFFFSHVHLFFYDQLEKSNLFLQAVIDTYKKDFSDKEVEWLFKNPLSDGGQFTGVANLVAKYGVIPADAMPETYNANNTNSISNLMTLKLREDGLILREMAAKKGIKATDLTAKKTEMLGEIYRMLALAYGVPPTTFTWTHRNAKGEVVSTEEYTPMSFYEKFAKQDFSNYYMVMNDPTRPYYKVYEIQYDRHVYDGDNWKYLNLPMDKIAPMCIASIKDSTMMYFSCDVGKFLDREKGYMDPANYDYESLLGVSFNMNKEQRVRTFASGSRHAMTLCAVDLDENGQPKKWMVENSWGPNYGHNGFLIMSNEWFNEYMFRVVLEEKYIPADIKAILNQEPIMLPAWDPMFAPEQ